MDNETVALALLYSYIIPEERGGKKMRKVYTENQHDIFFAHLSVWLRLRGIQPKRIFSLTRPIFLRSPSTQWRERTLHGVSAGAGHHGQGGGGQKDGSGADGCLGPNHISLGGSNLQPLRNGEGVSQVHLICSSPLQGHEAPQVPEAPQAFLQGRKSLAAVGLYTGLGKLWWSLQRPENPRIKSLECWRVGAAFP